ncbi:helix-turn-helix domain-containing protein [Falsirhodobacter halotolerans]|uniref:helix-turn-helix domain-containing protein n=1 Tax=Falsirhodobacter halotolerans TaxID=1146892 RepID=UPI001FD2F932|nr:helix-turn-helix domain-containing protein [Falsirhodobacter halotolerans]MCJ8138418.1 helix-turn-helix domain-containing protein [Falsirhodobacter halotolerans]
MSHSALVWLATVPAELSNAEFRVLYHLCNHHNDKTGLCFPPQSLLLERCGFSNGTLNNALNKLEERGLVQRHRSRDASHRKRPTQYEIALGGAKSISSRLETEKGNSISSGVETAGGETNSSGVKMEVGKAISKKRTVPSPKNGKSHLQPVGDKPVNKSKNNPQAGAPAHEGARDAAPVEADIPAFWAEKLNTGKFVASSAINAGMARAMLDRNLVTHDRLRAAGIVV